MTDTSIDAAVQALVDSSNGILEVTSVENKEGVEVSRIKCTATGHEMPPRVDVVTSHLNSKRFKKATEWYSYDFAQFEPFIVAHRRKPKCLFCNVTGIVLNKIPAEVEKHMKGKKFLRMKEHVKFFDEAEIDKDDDDFDANKFEFLNRQLVGSDDDDEPDDSDDDDAPKRKRKGGKKGDESDEDIDAIFYKDHSDDDAEAEDDSESKEVDSDIAGDDDDDEEEEAPSAKFVKKTASTPTKPKRKQASSAPATKTKKHKK